MHGGISDTWLRLELKDSEEHAQRYAMSRLMPLAMPSYATAIEAPHLSVGTIAAGKHGFLQSSEKKSAKK